jgi:hypothetical protein
MNSEKAHGSSLCRRREPSERIGWISLLAYLALCGLLFLSK